MNLIPVPPDLPDRAWVAVFVDETIRLFPGFSVQTAHFSATLAHPWCWLLDGREAAQLWSLAIGGALAQQIGSRRR